MRLLKNGKELDKTDADFMKHYVNRIIQEQDSYESAYTKKCIFDTLGYFLSKCKIGGESNSILNPEDIKRLKELAEKEKNSEKKDGEETKEIDIEDINKKIQKYVEGGYFMILDFSTNSPLDDLVNSYQKTIQQLLLKRGVGFSIHDTEPTKVNELAGPFETAIDDCINSLINCLKN